MVLVAFVSFEHCHLHISICLFPSTGRRRVAPVAIAAAIKSLQNPNGCTSGEIYKYLIGQGVDTDEKSTHISILNAQRQSIISSSNQSLWTVCRTDCECKPKKKKASDCGPGTELVEFCSNGQLVQFCARPKPKIPCKPKPKGVPSKPKGVPSKPKGVPSNPKGVPSKPKGVPSKSKSTPPCKPCKPKCPPCPICPPCPPCPVCPPCPCKPKPCDPCKPKRAPRKPRCPKPKPMAKSS